MNVLVPIALFGWIPVVLVLFAYLPPRRAVIGSYLAAWLFLPIAGYKIEGFLAYNKATAAGLAVLAGVLIFDSRRLVAFRPRWFDLPVAVWCLCPFASSLSNDLGAYDGLSAVVYQTISYGLPYFIGRLYCSDTEGIRELAIGVFWAGLIYMPLCLFEIRMSPQLHKWVYGFSQPSAWADTHRFGGWRPMVFMQHGLMLGMWMTATTLVAVWLWASGTVRRVLSLNPAWLVMPLILTTVACRSAGALTVLVAGLVVLLVGARLKTSLPLLCLLFLAPVYMGVRSSGYWGGQELVTAASQYADEDRAFSLNTRLENEDRLVSKALLRPVFGWGRWGRSRVYNDEGADISLTDGMWVIAIGQCGLVGLAALTAVLLLPSAAVVFWRAPSTWLTPERGPTVALAVVTAVYMLDCLSNAMENPVFWLAAGAASANAVRLATRTQVREARVAAIPAARDTTMSRWVPR